MSVQRKITADFTYVEMNDSHDLLIKAEKPSGQKIFFFMSPKGEHVTTKKKFFPKGFYDKAIKFGKKEKTLSESLEIHATKIANTHSSFTVTIINQKIPTTLGELFGDRLRLTTK